MVRAFKTTGLMTIFAVVSLASAYPIRREVPQEHSHEATLRIADQFLKLNNPDQIVATVFGLLGNAAASTGAGKIADPDCLQAATADQAFTNAKAAGSIEGMTHALIYRTLERNTGSVGGASVLCTSFQAKNPEIAALTQHQDPASNNAAAINKKITLELAKQIASIGGDPLDAIQSGTFAPGQIGDPTAAGNTCNDENDAVGCILSQNLLVEDATPEEIAAAVAGVAPTQGAEQPAATGGAGNGGNGNNGNGAAAPAATGIAAKNQNTGQCAVEGGAAPPPAQNNGEDVDEGDDEEVVEEPAPSGGAAETCPPPTTVTVTVAPGATAPATTGAPVNTGAPAPTQSVEPPANAAPGDPVKVRNVDLGDCENPSVKFGPGLDGRKATEFSFIPVDQTQFTHGSALNSQIIFQFVCDTLVNKCGFTNDDELVKGCRATQASLTADVKDPKNADIFNDFFGFESNFASIDVNAPTQSQTTPDADATGNATFRECEDPSVKFGGGFEGRAATELTFLPNNPEDFSHGSAKNPDIIYQFICDNLVNQCGFNNQDATVIKCRSVQQQVKALGFTGLSADTFNKDFVGITTNFAAIDGSA